MTNAVSLNFAFTRICLTTVATLACSVAISAEPTKSSTNADQQGIQGTIDRKRGRQTSPVSVERRPPSEIGSRTVVLDFVVDENTKPVAIDIVSTEATGLNPWAKAIVKSGDLRIDSPGVIKLAANKYRASLRFPLEGDGAPLPPNITLPKARIQPLSPYPWDLARSHTPGGALLRLTFDEKAKITKVEIVRASHKEFGQAAADAVNRWQYAKPARRDGVPVAVTLFQLFTFAIEGMPPAPWEWQMSPEPALPEYAVTVNFL